MLMHGFILVANLLAFIASLILVTISLGLMWFLFEEIWAQYGYLAILTGSIVPILSLLMINGSILRGMGYILMPQTVVKIMPHLVIITVALIYYNMNNDELLSNEVLISITLSAYIASLLTVLFLHRSKLVKSPLLNRKYDLRKWTSISMPMMSTAIVVQVQNQVDIIIAGMYLSTEDIAVYSVAKKIVGIVIFGLSAVSVVAAPTISKLWFSNSKVELQNYLTVIARLLVATTIPVVIFIYLFGQTMLGLFGSDYKEGYVSLLILVAGQSISAIVGAVALIMNMTDRHNQLAFILFLTAISNMVLSLLLIPNFGIIGAAGASSTAAIASNTFLYFYILKTHGLNTLLYTRN
jgi:O-antigen/teichoic acid export membrane protein